MSWMEYQFDETWGNYNDNNDTDKLMFSEIENHKESMCHYFQQFGMGLKKQLIEDLENMFPLFWKDEFKSKTRTVLINLLTEYLKKMMNEKTRSQGCWCINTCEGWIKSENCKHLANKRKEANRSFERKRISSNHVEQILQNEKGTNTIWMELGENEDETENTS